MSDRRPPRIAVVSQKGGVGKTTVTLNLALALAEARHRVLVVDTDPQGAMGLSLAQPDTKLMGLAEALLGTAPVEECILRTRNENLSFLPRGRLDPVDVCVFEQALFARGVLGDLLDRAEEAFDLVLVDTPSGLGMITRGALAVTDHALAIAMAEPLALRSIGQVLRVVEHVRATDNPRLGLLGILPTMVQLTVEPSQGVMAELWSGFPQVLETAIPRAEVFMRASEAGVPVDYLEGTRAPEARRFDLLAAEIDDRLRALDAATRVEAPRERRALL